MFENKVINGYTYASRFIMSWVRVGGTLTRRDTTDFEKWLESLGLSDEDVMYILNLARNGKLELEVSAWEFIKNMNGNNSLEGA
jgi:hypothetical protein